MTPVEPQRLRLPRPVALIAVGLVCVSALRSRAAEPATGPAIAVAKLQRSTAVDFEAEILPMLRDNCLACHNRTRAKADLILETPADILGGSENGPVLIPGDARQSLLLQAAAHQAKPPMPPKDNKVSAIDLTSAQLGLLSLWIDQGAKGEVRIAARPIEWQAPANSLQAVYAVALTPDGRYAAAGRANRVDLYDMASQRLIGSLCDPQLLRSRLYGPAGAAHRDMVESLAFSPDGSLLASGGFGEVKLWRRAAPATKFTLAAPPAGVVAVSPDGRHIAIACEGSPVQLFDAATGKRASAIATSTSAARAIAFSPDGTMLAVASADHGLRVSTVAGALVAQTVAPSDINAITWAGGGKQIATAGADGVIRLWQLPEASAISWAAPKELKGHAGAVTALAAMPGGSRLLSGGADGSIREWNLSDGQVIRQLSQGSPVTLLAVRPDGKFFASAGQANAAHLWDAAKGTAAADLKGNIFVTRELAARDRAQQLAAGNVTYFKAGVQKAEAAQKAAADRVKVAADARAAADKLAAEKEAKRAKAAGDKEAADKALASMQADLQQKTAAAEAAEQQVKEAQASLATAKAAGAGPSPEDLKVLQEQIAAKTKAAAGAKAAIAKLAADAKPKQAADEAAKALEKAETELKATMLSRANIETESRLAALASTRVADDLSAATSALASATESLQHADSALAAARQAAASAAEKPVRALAFSPDNLTLATAGDDALVNLWSADGAALLDSIRAQRPAITTLAFCGEDALLITDQSQSALWMLGNGSWSLERAIGSGDGASPLTDRVNALAFSPDGRLLATGSGEPSRTGQVKLWDLATGRPVRDFADAHSDTVLALEFSPDGKSLASGAADHFAKVLDVASGKVLKSFEGHTEHVLGVSWKADGRVLATCGADNQVKFWDAVSGDRKSNAAGFGKAVNAVHFLGAGDQAVAVAADGQVRIVNDSGGAVRNVAGVAGDFFQAAAVTPDGRWIAVGGQAGQITAWREPPAAPPVVMTFPPPPQRLPATRPTPAVGNH